MIQKVRAVVFPHSFVPDGDMKRALSVFDAVTLFQPWFMRKPLSVAALLPELVRVRTPSEHLRPPGNLEALLTEYRQWIRSNDEKAFAAFLAFTGARGEEDPPSWEIRRAIGRVGQRVERADEEVSLRRHLILHLAEETEAEQREAEKMFKSLKDLGSPLKGALEEDLPGLLSDLQGLDGEAIFSKERLTQILDAWGGLFSDKLTGEQPLLTFSPQVLKYVVDTWEELAPAREGMRPSSLELPFPDLSALSPEDFLDKRKAFLEDSALPKAVGEFCHDPGQNVFKLRNQAHGGFFPSRRESVLLTLRYLFPLPEGRIPRRYEFIKPFSGKIIGLIGEQGIDEK
jgi:hypothetical protein